MSAIFFLIGLALIILPFLPALFEVLKRTDVVPLAVSNQLLDDPRAEPNFLFWHLAELLGVASPEQLMDRLQITKPTLAVESVLLIPSGQVPRDLDPVGRVLSAGPLEIPADSRHLNKLYSLGSITSESGAALSEVHARKKLTLGQKTKVMWWASGEEVVLKNAQSLPGKVQAILSLTVEGDADFHVLQAPLVQSQAKIAALPREVHLLTNDRKVVKKDFVIEENETFTGNLVVKGKLTLKAGAKVFGDVKAHHSIHLMSGAQIFGSVFCLKQVTCDGQNFIYGSLLAQEEAVIGPNCEIGTEKRSVTVSAKDLRIQAPFLVHGILRAWKSGKILK